jgi:integrase
MATIKFRLQSKKEISNIYVRVRDGKNTDIETPTGFTTNPNLWSETKGEPLQKANNPEKLNLKVQLEKLKTKIIESLNTDKGSGTPINKEWLIDVIAKFKNPLLEQKTEYLKDLIKDYQTEMKTKINPKTGKQISHLTIKSFETTLMRLKKFEEYKNKRFLISDVDLTFKNDFVKYESEKLLISQNSISKDIRQIKTVCLDASDKGFKISEQVRSRKFYIKEEQTAFVTITESEIELIKKCDLKKVNYLENARDWLIIGCWTGCRVSDLMQLTNDNIQITTKGVTSTRENNTRSNLLNVQSLRNDLSCYCKTSCN